MLDISENKHYPWHKVVFARLANMYDNARIPSALLITGISGTGKLTISLRFIALLLCEQPKVISGNKEACGICKSCKFLANDDLGYSNIQKNTLIRHSHNEGLIYLQRELNKNNKLSEQILIDQVRTFCNSLYKTTNAKIKIGLLYYGDDLKQAGADSLLKTLEEPPENTIIIILAHKAKNLPKTILSRCQKVHIKSNYDKTTISWLDKKIADTNIDSQELLSLNYGAPLAALNMIENDEYTKHLLWQEYLLLLALKPASISDKQPDDKIMALKCLRDIITKIVNIKVVKTSNSNSDINYIASKSNIDFLFNLLTDIEKALQLQHTTINISLLLEGILIVWSHITHLASYPNIFDN